MSLLFAGGEMGAFIASDSGTYETTSSDGFARGFLKCGAGSSSSYGESASFTAIDEGYVHFNFNNATVGTYTHTMLEVRDGTNARLRLSNTTGATTASVQMQYWNGAAFVNAGSAVTYSNSTEDTFDLYFDANVNPGTLKLYIAGTLRETASSLNLTSVASLDNIRSYGVNSATGGLIRHVIVADEPTIGMRLGTVYASGAGATSDFTGTHTSIDENVYSDADFIYSATNGHISLFTGTAPTLTGYVVRAVAVTSRSKCGAAGPQNLQHVLRVSGVNYASSSHALDVGYGAFCDIWEQNPGTVADWLVADIAALQFGVKAVT